MEMETDGTSWKQKVHTFLEMIQMIGFCGTFPVSFSISHEFPSLGTSGKSRCQVKVGNCK